VSTSSVETRVRKFIADNFPLRAKPEAIDADESLMGAGVIDSAGVLELVEFVEAEFGLTIPFEDLVPENFDTIRNVTAYVSAHVATATDAAA
jgi:acyl carrier protein